MKLKISSIGPVVLTLAVVAVGAVVVKHLWDYYTVAPWTRDGHIRADIVQVSPDVSGLITRINVKDNQRVKQGDVLFEIDTDRYALALQQAQATAASIRATLAQSRREARRSQSLSDVVSKEVVEEGFARVAQQEASLAQAEAAIGVARLNLQRTRVLSPVDGYVNDKLPRLGDYATTGRPVLAMVDVNSYHVEGYFEETKLHGIHIGSPVDMRVMGESRVLHGRVLSIAAGIEDRDRTTGANLLPNVNPTFNWVRLAQRVPVRVVFDPMPEDIRLIAGRTVTVSVRDEGKQAGNQAGKQEGNPSEAPKAGVRAASDATGVSK
ncbi:efflux RND transporter periplasmic adaptor subunit [Cupriavidus plantarum]|uniref:RND family efflux transporter MFP subunit n=1 Tax=Cupriavidus plantarum TaxID=942865 RepID=A0A316EVB9_9BURK|nr:HlyD family secretion protein [Cupriavidus plantarum]NYI00709.1 multidrug resistance efflux pump [Cupriavidus plantarum]PWK35119.1 RND family efflux transporter MFP subunit [Cupriavidus plantarum]REE93566.1 RND family efflux transporter MFP subunit [Cupriavidus plantarum]RLK38989.1 RND family efflux transporter MFP subunit [Cupriavidus plantarum]CAG2136057.1 p-hydroxybenzoic acid efflux pump subunit AaeA [Cupriavidus plantarum]